MFIILTLLIDPHFVSSLHQWFSLLGQINLALCYWDFDFAINSNLTVALNIYERSILQTMRLSCFVLLSPVLKSEQKPLFVLNFVVRLANRFYYTIDRWTREKAILCTLSREEIKWIVAKAFHFYWSSKKLQHRVEEIKAIKSEIKHLEDLVDLIKRLEWSEYFETNLNPAFATVKLINEKR